MVKAMCGEVNAVALKLINSCTHKTYSTPVIKTSKSWKGQKSQFIPIPTYITPEAKAFLRS